MKPRLRILGGFLIAAAAIAGGGASGATITYNFSELPQNTDINQSGTLHLFNPTLGTLEGVSVTVGMTETASNVSVTNKATTNVKGRAVQTSDLTYGSTLTTLNGVLAGLSPTLGWDTLVQNYTPGETKYFGPFTGTNTNTFTNPTAGALNEFIGTSDFTLTGSTLTGLTLYGFGGNINLTTTTVANLFGSVTYTYLSVPGPTPATGYLGLFGLALGAAALKLRERLAR